MSIATLYIIPRTPEEFNVWSFAHAAHHRDILRRIYEVYGSRLDEYVLDPFDPLDPGNWTALHQVMHQQMDAILGIAGYDLTELDWTDEAGLRAWMSHQGNEHYQAGTILGV